MHPLFSANTIIFDLDGTIVDTAPDLCASLNHCLSLKGLSALPVAKVRHLVGHGAKALLRQGLETYDHPNIDTTIETLFPEFISHYADNIAVESKPYDGVFTLLDKCKAEGKKLGICTNKPGFLANPLLEALKLASYFDAILGSDNVKNKKPHGDHILETIKAVGGVSSNALMLGDSEVDYYAAKNADIPIILVGHGYSKVPLKTLESDLYIDSILDLI